MVAPKAFAFVTNLPVKVDILNAFVNTNYRAEIQQEDIVRNLGDYSRFVCPA